PVYETQPVGVAVEQQDYLNRIIVISTELTAPELLAVCQDAEVILGRPGNHAAAAPRTMDIDIITYGNLVLSSEGLILPHPRYWERKFVLVPLADIEPTFHDPVTGRSIQQLVEGCPDTSSIERWDQVGSAVC
ncbi:MAG: 2-amino-4-hydroxy-6-hydroxymethyldihydropteridine diphosphokinase, partial [Fidelibacterota bacterium]